MFHIYYILLLSLLYSLRCLFYTSYRRLPFTEVWVTASLLRSPILWNGLLLFFLWCLTPLVFFSKFLWTIPSSPTSNGITVREWRLFHFSGKIHVSFYLWQGPCILLSLARSMYLFYLWQDPCIFFISGKIHVSFYLWQGPCILLSRARSMYLFYLWQDPCIFFISGKIHVSFYLWQDPCIFFYLGQDPCIFFYLGQDPCIFLSLARSMYLFISSKVHVSFYLG